MKSLYAIVLLMFLAAPAVLAETQDTTVFRTRMTPENEVPALTVLNLSGTANITVRVTRDGAGNVNAATVLFEIDYTVPGSTTFTGLHIHYGPAATNGNIVIDTGITTNTPVAVNTGTGRITRTVNYNSSETFGLQFVRGLLAAPENYYVDVHTTANPTGVMRGQFLRSSLTFRPVMSSSFEVPAITGFDATGAALVEVNVTRDVNGVITSGSFEVDVDYQFPSAVTLTGLHIHNGAAGSNGLVVIDTGLNETTRAVSISAGRGNIFRSVDIPSTDVSGIAALNGLMNNPAQYYIDIHTTVYPNGVMRGQFSRNVLVFFNTMTGAEVVPTVATSGIANSMTYVRVDRDSTGSVYAGVVSFNVNYNLGGGSPVTLTGLHIHNGAFGANGSAVIESGISSANPLVDDDGIGTFSSEVTINASNPTALDALRGIADNPEVYYVDTHSTVNPGGVVRAQLERETYHFKADMSSANEHPAITPTVTGTGWVTVVAGRDAAGAINGGSTVFDVNHTLNAAATITGLHIHTGVADIDGPVVIDTGVSGRNSVDSPTGNGNITRTATTAPANTNGITALNNVINNPAGMYVDLHTIVNEGGYIRSQLLPTVNNVAQVVGGGEWLTSITVRNSSSTASVQGMMNSYQANGTSMPVTISDPNISFALPPSGSATFNMHNKGTLTSGFAKVFTNGAVTLDAAYSYPGYADSAHVIPVTARSISIPVRVGGTATQNTGIAILAGTAGNVVLTLRDNVGVAIAGGSRSIAATANQQIVGFVRDLITTVTQPQFTGNLTVEMQAAIGTGQLSAIALQFDATLTPVTLTALP